jgi:hypothetical protein
VFFSYRIPTATAVQAAWADAPLPEPVLVPMKKGYEKVPQPLSNKRRVASRRVDFNQKVAVRVALAVASWANGMA